MAEPLQLLFLIVNADPSVESWRSRGIVILSAGGGSLVRGDHLAAGLGAAVGSISTAV